MKTLMKIVGKCINGVLVVKLVFDSRHEMPTMEDIKAIRDSFMPEIKRFKLIDPPMDYLGKYTTNYFDILSYKEEHSLEDFELKTIYENSELIDDFNKTPEVLWVCKNADETKKLITVDEFAKIYNFDRNILEMHSDHPPRRGTFR